MFKRMATYPLPCQLALKKKSDVGRFASLSKSNLHSYFVKLHITLICSSGYDLGTIKSDHFNPLVRQFSISHLATLGSCVHTAGTYIKVFRKRGILIAICRISKLQIEA